MKNAAQILNDKRYRSPRLSSPTREVELAVRAAREDVCFNIMFALTVILFTFGHWIVGIFSLVFLILQGLEATLSEIELRTERWKIDLSNTDVNGGP